MSEGFSAQWLALREPADARARAPALLDALLAGLAAAGDLPWPILDLGAGTGANLRWLAPRLAALGVAAQDWTCADHDPALRAQLPLSCADWARTAGLAGEADAGGCMLTGAGWSVRARTLDIDLAAGLADLPLPTGGLLSASALLDLVSTDWLALLLERAAAARCRLLFALTYDGRCRFAPTDADDERLVALVNRHQRVDKGFGPALGPSAAAHARRAARALGYRVVSAASDWVIDGQAPNLQRALIAGWMAAAIELDPAARAWLGPWQARRDAQISAARLCVRVGHQDLVALPPAGG